MPTRSSWFLLAPLLALSLLGGDAPRARAQEALPSRTQPKLEALLKEQVAALNAEDTARVMKVFHPKAPGLADLRRTLVHQFRSFDDRYRVHETFYVGVDGPYAYLRVRQFMQGVREGKPFELASEDLLVFKRAGKEWKAWTSARLDQHRIKAPKRRTPRRPR